MDVNADGRGTSIVGGDVGTDGRGQSLGGINSFAADRERRVDQGLNYPGVLACYIKLLLVAGQQRPNVTARLPELRVLARYDRQSPANHPGSCTLAC